MFRRDETFPVVVEGENFEGSVMSNLRLKLQILMISALSLPINTGNTVKKKKKKKEEEISKKIEFFTGKFKLDFFLL